MRQAQKTTWIGLLIVALTAAVQAAIPILPQLLAPLAANPRWSWIPYIAGVVLTAIGPALSHRSEDGQSFFNFSRLTGGGLPCVALLVVASLLAACGGNTVAEIAKRRDRLTKIAGYGQTIQGLLEANRTLPDQLLAEHVINDEVYQRIAAGFHDAGPLVTSFNEGLKEVLASADVNPTRLVSIVSRLIEQARTLEGIQVNAEWQRVLGGIQVALRAIASYFAVARAEAHAQGYTDQQVAAYAGVPYDRRMIERIEAYAAAPPNVVGVAGE
jgi:hypothetical protein